MALHLMRPKPGRGMTPVTLCSAITGEGLDDIVEGLFDLHASLVRSGDIEWLRRTQAYNQFRAAYEQGIFEQTDIDSLNELFETAASPIGAAYRTLAKSDRTSEVNAITLFVSQMGRSISFYQTLGLELVFGGDDAPFSTLQLGTNYINLELQPTAMPVKHWGRVVLFVQDPDSVHEIARNAGFDPHGEPADAPWGERFFHISDPDGHELSFARPL
jgi:catechol 2,3-dioxygenase-like lactoylglutathione lyase family enzyme